LSPENVNIHICTDSGIILQMYFFGTARTRSRDVRPRNTIFLVTPDARGARPVRSPRTNKMATRSLLCAESEAQRVPLLVRARDGGSDGAGAASGSLGPSSRRSLSVAATLVTALVVGAVVAVARGDAAGVATRLGGYAFPGAALGEGVGDAATRAADAFLASDVANARGAGGVSSSARRDQRRGV
jgi:hypothetical protein